jgi:predicted RNA-binding protein with PIN domain
VRILVVDGANVVGSRPDGWWRDREGAARRLLSALVESELDFDEVVLVLEGKARLDVESEQGDVTIVNASGSGDDTVVAQVAAAHDPVVVVTSDRGLRARVAAAGGECVGPSWLLSQVNYSPP